MTMTSTNLGTRDEYILPLEHPLSNIQQIQNTQIRSKLSISTNENIKIKEKISSNTINVKQEIGKLDRTTISEIASVLDVSELSELLKMFSRNYPQLGRPTLRIIYNPETKIPVFIEIIFPNGSWEEWKKIVKKVKGEMKHAGLENLVTKVAITCLQGLKE